MVHFSSFAILVYQRVTRFRCESSDPNCHALWPCLRLNLQLVKELFQATWDAGLGGAPPTTFFGTPCPKLRKKKMSPPPFLVENPLPKATDKKNKCWYFCFLNGFFCPTVDGSEILPPLFTDPEKTWVSNNSIATYWTGSVGKVPLYFWWIPLKHLASKKSLSSTDPSGGSCYLSGSDNLTQPS